MSFRRRDASPPRAAIVGCAGTELTAAERASFAAADPLGFILFARNVADPRQLAALCAALRGCVGRADAPILIDQEGGRVRRLRPPHWRMVPAAGAFGDLHARAPRAALEAARLAGRLVAVDCLDAGIDVVCAPCADIPIADGHDVIGDRAYGRMPATVAALALAMADGLSELGAIPVMKHMPGHGRARADSHHELPVVDAPLGTLEAVDAAPFRALADLPWGMTAHVLYTALDPARPGTVSPAVIGFVRERIGFGGVLVSDDLAMQALQGTPPERACAALAAGCDVALYCDGVLANSIALLDAVPPLTAAAVARLARARSQVRRRLVPEPQRWQGRMDALVCGAAT